MTRSTPTGIERSAEWIYRGLWSLLTGLFLVPSRPPTLPGVADHEVKVLRPAPGFLRYMKFWFWLLLLPLDLVIIIPWVIILVTIPLLGFILLPLAFVLAVLPDLLAYIAIHLRYDTTWYILSDRAMRLHRGVWSIHEATITYENVQDVKVYQGPVQRYFGIATVCVSTAGGAGASADQHGSSIGHRGLIEGIDDPEMVRDLILARLRQTQTAGLGDEAPNSRDAHEAGRAGSESQGFGPGHITLLREIHGEIARLRAITKA